MARPPKNKAARQPLSRDLDFADNGLTATLFGDLNKNLQTVERCCGVTIHVRGMGVHISGRGHEVELAAELLDQFYGLIRKGLKVFSSDFAFGLRVLESNPHARLDKIFLTRIGFDSQAVITGDITQVDLPAPDKSGLLEAGKILGAIEGIAFCPFTQADVVRHPLVQKIITAYEKKAEQKVATDDPTSAVINNSTLSHYGRATATTPSPDHPFPSLSRRG